MLARLALIAFLGIATPVWAGPVEIKAAITTVQTSASEWQRAESIRNAAEVRVETLANEIGALRRRSDDASRRTLEDRLAASVEASKAAELAARQEREAKARLEARVAQAVKVIDAELLAKKPGLRSTDESERLRTAREMKSLIDERNALKKHLAVSAAQKASVTPSIQVDPLDGPEELREKAEVTEDQRDRISKKRAALASLISEVRQEREVARAAGTFQRDVSMFDEEARNSERAPRSSTAKNAESQPLPPAAAQDDASKGGVPNAVGIPTAGRGSQTPEADPGTDFAAAPNAPSVGSESASTVRIGSAQEGARRAAVNPQSFATANSSALARTADPAYLLGVRVEELSAAGTDLKSLEKLLSELTRLETDLDAKAKSIRSRADKLEAEEVR